MQWLEKGKLSNIYTQSDPQRLSVYLRMELFHYDVVRQAWASLLFAPNDVNHYCVQRLVWWRQSLLLLPLSTSWRQGPLFSWMSVITNLNSMHGDCIWGISHYSLTNPTWLKMIVIMTQFMERKQRWEYLWAPLDILLKVEVVELLLAMKYNNVISSGTHDL